MEDDDLRGGGVNYDARVGRTFIISNTIAAILNSHQENNYHSWLKHLKNLYWICSPYIKNEQAQELKALLARAQSYLSSKVPQQELYNLFDRLTELSILYYKDQLQKSEGSGEDEFTEDELFI